MPVIIIYEAAVQFVVRSWRHLNVVDDSGCDVLVDIVLTCVVLLPV